MAIKFWGLAIGRIIPPILHANAIVSILRGEEPNMEVTTTEAATFDTIAEMNKERREMERWNLNQSSDDEIRDASRRVIWYLSRVWAIRKEEIKRKMTGSKKVATATLDENRPSMMESGRIRMEVTNGGIASETHRIDENINNDRQRRACTASGNSKGRMAANNAATIKIIGGRLRFRMVDYRK
jgi:hypothetical protein